MHTHSQNSHNKRVAYFKGFTVLWMTCMDWGWKYKVEKCSEEHVAVICTIKFTGNYETSWNPVIVEDMANATINNTSDFGQIFLETIACNRAFVRCVRNFLNVHIVGDDEINKNNGVKKTSTTSSKTQRISWKK